MGIFIPFALVLLFPCVYCISVLYGFKVSFYDYTISRSVFCGWDNYRQAFGSEAFWRSVSATFGYAVIILPVTVIVSLWISKVLSTHGKR